MASATDICNLALLHLKSALRIGNIDTDTTEVAQICNIVYPILRDKFQADRPWSFCKATAALTLVEQNPNQVWAFSYAYLPDCLFFRRIQAVVSVAGSQLEMVTPPGALVVGNPIVPANDTEQSAVPFEVAAGLIFTDMPNAIGEYTRRNTDEATWPAQVVLAFSYELAALLAPAVSDGDPFNMIQKMEALAERKMNEAAASNANERMARQNTSEFTRMR